MPAYFVCVIVLLSDYMLAKLKQHTWFLLAWVCQDVTPLNHSKSGLCVMLLCGRHPNVEVLAY